MKVDGNDFTVISLNNTKELLELLSNEFTDYFITTYGINVIDNFFISMKAQIKDKNKEPFQFLKPFARHILRS